MKRLGVLAMALLTVSKPAGSLAARFPDTEIGRIMALGDVGKINSALARHLDAVRGSGARAAELEQTGFVLGSHSPTCQNWHYREPALRRRSIGTYNLTVSVTLCGPRVAVAAMYEGL